MLDDIRPPEGLSTPSQADNKKATARQVSGEASIGGIALMDRGGIEEPATTLQLKLNGGTPHRLGARIKALSRTKKIIIVGLMLIITSSAVCGSIFAFAVKPVPEQHIAVPIKQPPPEPPKPTTEPSKLTGLTVPLEVNKRAVLGVMVENSPDARPQAGLKEAGIIFEAIAEGGITRFLLLFQDTEAGRIGPIRSVRPYYIDWFAPYQASIAHVGGSAEALAQLRNEGHRDLDQSFNSGSYSRIKERYAPHNVYSSTARLTELMNSKGFTTSEFTGLARKPAETPATAVTARAIDLRISSPLYNVHYDYIASTNSYNRSLAGTPHVDEPSGAVLSPKTVVALVVPYGISPNRVNSVYETSGTGKAYVFQDGVAVEGTWEKASRAAQYTFKAADGSPILLNPGQTWFTAIADTGRISYAP